jgi:RNA polymerase-binding transcription factor DksA
MSAWRARLNQERRFRIEQLAGIHHDTTTNSRLAHDEVTMALRSAAISALNHINAALARMDTGEYGRCLRCAGPIPSARLDVLPMTALCMPCQHHQQTGRPVRS